MSDPFDPIEGWLSADVELMPPAPGTFEVVHRRARRRKAAVATMTAAAAAVVIAAAVAVPQLASSLLPNNGGGPARIKTPNGSSSSTQRPGPSPSHSASSHPSPSHPKGSPTPAGVGPSILNSSAAPDPGFAPTSITFVNSSVGAVLGRSAAGTSMAGTLDYGQTWKKVGAPPAGPPSGNSGVSQVRFLDGNNGWAFGPELYATHTGGATWTKITGLAGRVIDLSTVGVRAYAVVAACGGSGSDFAGGCRRFSLYSALYNSDDWQPVPGLVDVAAKLPVRPGGLQLTGQYGYLLAGSTLFAGSPSGGAWERVIAGSGPGCVTGSGAGLDFDAGVIAPGANSDLFLICRGNLYASTDAGQTWHRSGAFTGTGSPSSLAVAPGSGTLVAATGSGIFYSADQRTWHRAGFGGGSGPVRGFSFVGMTTTSQGVAIPADAQLREIFISQDGGRSWKARAIS